MGFWYLGIRKNCATWWELLVTRARLAILAGAAPLAIDAPVLAGLVASWVFSASLVGQLVFAPIASKRAARLELAGLVLSLLQIHVILAVHDSQDSSLLLSIGRRVHRLALLPASAKSRIGPLTNAATSTTVN